MTNLDIVICVNGLPFDGETIKKGGLGGSETAGYYLAKSLADMGHRVVMFTNTEREGLFDNVHYQSIATWESYVTSTPHDVCIIQRMPELFAKNIASKFNILWQHDLALKRVEKIVKGALWNVDKIMVVSEYHKKQYQDVYDLPDHVFHVTKNGIDLDLFKKKS